MIGDFLVALIVGMALIVAPFVWSIGASAAESSRRTASKPASLVRVETSQAIEGNRVAANADRVVRRRPNRRPEARVLARVNIIATCREPAAPCETVDTLVPLVEDVFEEFEIRSQAVRPGTEPLADDDILIRFRTQPKAIKGFVTGETTPVLDEFQQFTLEQIDGAVFATHAWKMKIELDERDQFRLFIEFLGAPDGQRRVPNVR